MKFFSYTQIILIAGLLCISYQVGDNTIRVKYEIPNRYLFILILIYT